MKRKVFAMLLAMAMLLTLVSATAADSTTATITITDANENATFAAYRLLNLSTTLTCTETAGDHEHSESCYGYAYSVNPTYKSVLVTLSGVVTTDKTDDEISAAIVLWLSAQTGDSTRTVANALFTAIVTAGMTADATTNTNVFSSVPQGYYFIVETTEELENGEFISLSILDTLGKEEVSIESKDAWDSENDDVPAIEKYVGETAFAEPDKYMDAGEGDLVWFTIVPNSSFCAVAEQTWTLHDTIPAGLSFVSGSFKVFVKNAVAETTNDIPDNKISFQTNPDGSTSFEYTPTARGYTSFKVSYQVQVDPDAVKGGLGNINTAYMSYASNPNPGHEDERNNTDSSTATVFVFDLQGIKTNADGSVKLDGAQFRLYKMDGSNKQYYRTGTVAQPIIWTSTVADATVKTSAVTTGEFAFPGLDAGTYYLEEIAAPTGYNPLLEPVKVEIIPAYDSTTNTLTGLTVKIDDAAAVTQETTGTVVVPIKNSTGVELPATGGVGTTIFVVGGSLLALAALVWIIVRIRARKPEEEV